MEVMKLMKVSEEALPLDWPVTLRVHSIDLLQFSVLEFLKKHGAEFVMLST